MNLKDISNRLHHRIADMSIAGQFKKGFLFEVLVYSKDGGSEPHIHIVDENTGGDEFSTCVKLTSPEYFPHGGKYTDTFNSRQKKSFVEFMSAIRTFSNKRMPAMSNYEFCCTLWNENNSKVQIEFRYDENDELIIPDYSQL